MHIVCPHCRNPIELVQLSAQAEIACPSCGSSFHLETGTTTGWTSQERQKLSRFEIVSQVGQGAFGTVYKARDPQLDRIVALKVPRAGNLGGPQEQDRFLREARSVAQLRHPSIVAVHEVGQAGEVPCLVSDFVEGVTLGDRLSAGQPSARAATELVASVADALHYAHEQGVVHRDVKPSNIMLDTEGRPHVMDFGLAKRDAGEITMTMDGQVLGTPAYMAPEQARGESHRVDGRSDVYSLGVLLYQMLTGELPFRGTKRMLLYQVLHDEPRPPRRLNDTIARDLETITLKAMAKEPARRYGTARELAEDLRRWLQGEPIQARPVGRGERLLRWVKRRPAAAALLIVSGVAALALMGLGVGLAYHTELNEAYVKEAAARLAEHDQRQKAEDALGVAEQAKKGEQVERKKAEDALERADRIGYLHSIFLADQALKENKLQLARQRLQESKEALRGWEWHYLNGQCHFELLSFPGKAIFSPDGSRLAVQGPDGNMRVFDSQDGQESFSLLGPLGLDDLVFNHDGSQLAVRGSDGVVGVLDAHSGQEFFTLQGPVGRGLLVFSPDGKRLAASNDAWGTARSIRVFEARSGKEILTLQPPVVVRELMFNHDGSWLAVLGLDWFVRVFDARSGQEAVKLNQLLVPHC